MTTIKRTMSCIKVTSINNSIKKEKNIHYFDNYERSFMCKKIVETVLYKLNCDYTLYNDIVMYFNNMLHILNKEFPSCILNKTLISQPVNNKKTCFLHMLYNKDNQFTIIIEESSLNKVLEIIFYNEIMLIPLIH